MTERAGPGEPAEALTPPSDPWAATAPPISPGPLDASPPWVGGEFTRTVPAAAPGAPAGGLPPTLAVPTRAPVPAPRAPVDPVLPRAAYARRRRRRWPWVMGTLAVLGLAVCGVGAALVAPILQQHPARVSTPPEMAGLTRVTALDPYARELREDLLSDLAVDTAFAGVYAAGEVGRRELAGIASGDIAEDVQAVIFLGVTLLVLNPDGFLDQAIVEATSRGEDLSGVRDFDPGSGGGRLRCGTATDDAGLAVVICAWADHGSIGVTINYDRDLADSADLLRRIRTETLTRR